MQLLIVTLTDNYNEEEPFRFSKPNIKDDFWRLAVSNKDVLKHFYVLPQFHDFKDIKDIKVVVPNFLQIGWCESPPSFCDSPETASDSINTLLKEVKLPVHPCENKMVKEEKHGTRHRLTPEFSYTNLMEIFSDNFIAATNNLKLTHLTHFPRSMLQGVHYIQPPPPPPHTHIDNHQRQDTISQNTLSQV